MTRTARAAALTAACALFIAPAAAEEDERRSGYDDMNPETQAIQDDDFSNPGMFWVQEGEALFATPEGNASRACADCHDAAEMDGIAARYPAFDEKSGTAVDLPGRVNLCRVRHQESEPLPRESRELLALTAFIGNRSRGFPITPDPDPRMNEWRERGAELYDTRIGQLNFACANCHDANAGRSLAGNVIPQAHPTGYPLYRFEWQELGSLQRRLRNCMIGFRAEPYAYGDEAFIAIEAFLMQRAAGMEIETPAVRP